MTTHRPLWLQVFEEVVTDLERFGDRVSGEIDSLGRQAELEPPYIRSHYMCIYTCTCTGMEFGHYLYSLLHECEYKCTLYF